MKFGDIYPWANVLPFDDDDWEIALADDRRSVGLCLRTEVEKLDRRARGPQPDRRAFRGGPVTAAARSSLLDLLWRRRVS
jgi:hypothetical protein